MLLQCSFLCACKCLETNTILDIDSNRSTALITLDNQVFYVYFGLGMETSLVDHRVLFLHIHRIVSFA